MSIAYWCVLAAGILPYITVGVAKARSSYDNRNPRAPDTYRGLAARAHGAHQNGFEVFPLFAVAVLVASRADPHARLPPLDGLAILWVGLRGAYSAAYLGDRPTTRSMVWILGLLVCVTIFTMPLWHG